jgi:hypothetical protein
MRITIIKNNFCTRLNPDYLIYSNQTIYSSQKTFMRTLVFSATFLSAILFFSCQSLYAQTDSAAKKSYFKAGMGYVSNAVYSGRKDSSVVSYIKPSIAYVNRSGFSLGAEMSVLANSTDAGRVDEIALEAGYDYTKGNFDAGAYASKYFYSEGSYAVASELEANAGAYFSYDADFLKFGAGGDFLISTSSDVNVYFNISHPFGIGADSNKLTISPTAQITAGTQNFYRAYYQNRKFSFNTSTTNGSGGSSVHSKGHHTGTGTAAGSSKTLTFLSQNRFDVLDYEASVPVEYEHKRWGFHATPVLAVPVNPMTYTIDGVLQKESLTTSFFIEAGVYLKF